MRPTRTSLLSSLVTASLSSITKMSAAKMAPPVAKRVPHVVKFGKVEGENRGTSPMDPPRTMQDDLFWLRDDTRNNEEILALLREENAYTEDRTSYLADARASLYDELLSHVEEDDDTFPAPAADGFEYWSRTVKGKSFRQFLRRARGTDASSAASSEQIMLDVNEVPSLPFFQQRAGWDAAQCDVHAVEVSPSGKLLAYSVDGSGYETYAIRLRDLATGAEPPEQLEGTAGSVSWVSK